jgi:hypothetical protein
MIKKVRQVLIALFVFLFLLPLPGIFATRMQASMANAGINLGCLAEYIPRFGITPGNSAMINNWINTVDSEIQVIISLYQAPYTTETLTQILNRLRRFAIITARWNNNQKGSFFHGIYGQLKQQFSILYESSRGLYYGATCDTFVLNFGYNYGRAWIGAWTMDRNLFSSGRSGMYLAINEGINCSNRIGCSFSYRATWNSLNLQYVDTNQEFRNILGTVLGIITSLRGSNSRFGIPSSPGTRIPPPPSGLIGRWSLSGQIMEFRNTSAGIRGYIAASGGGYRAGEEVYIIDRVSGNTYYGRAKAPDQYGRVSWIDITILVSGNTATISSAVGGSVTVRRVN